MVSLKCYTIYLKRLKLLKVLEINKLDIEDDLSVEIKTFNN